MTRRPCGSSECRGGSSRSLITHLSRRLWAITMWSFGEVRSALDVWDVCLNVQKHRIEASNVQLWSWFLVTLSSVNMSNMNHNLSTNSPAEQHFCTFQELSTINRNLQSTVVVLLQLENPALTFVYIWLFTRLVERIWICVCLLTLIWDANRWSVSPGDLQQTLSASLL